MNEQLTQPAPVYAGISSSIFLHGTKGMSAAEVKPTYSALVEGRISGRFAPVEELDFSNKHLLSEP